MSFHFVLQKRETTESTMAEPELFITFNFFEEVSKGAQYADIIESFRGATSELALDEKFIEGIFTENVHLDCK